MPCFLLTAGLPFSDSEVTFLKFIGYLLPLVWLWYLGKEIISGHKPDPSLAVLTQSTVNLASSVATLGNAQSGLNSRLKNLPNGIYYWSVQAVDTAFQGGPFAGNAVFAAGSTLSASQLWRFQYFGSVENTGPGADLNDAEGDGLVNLLEFATGAHPLTFTPPIGQLVKNGANLEFTYSRPVSVLADVSYLVEASTTLSGTWSPVTSTVISDDGITQVVKAIVPAGTGKRFVRLRVTRL